jgi:hypothetical protein
MTAISMRRFAIGLAVVFATLIAAAWTWAVYGRMWFLDPEYPMWVVKMQMIRDCAHGETTIFGDSRPVAGLIPDRMGRGVVNLSLGGGTPIEFAHQVEQIVRCPTLPKRVIVSFPPYHLMKVDSYWGRSALFGFLDFRQMEAVRETSQRLGDILIYSGKIGEFIANYSYAISFPSYYFPAMVNAWFVTRKKQNDIEFDMVLRSRGHHFFGTAPSSNGPSQEAWLGRFKPAPVLDHYLDKGIALLSKNNIPVYFVGMPLNEMTFQMMRPDLRAEFAKYVEQFARRYKNFQVVGDFLPSLPGKYFGDPVHLNPIGAQMWSELVAKRILEASENEDRLTPPG